MRLPEELGVVRQRASEGKGRRVLCKTWRPFPGVAAAGLCMLLWPALVSSRQTDAERHGAASLQKPLPPVVFPKSTTLPEVMPLLYWNGLPVINEIVNGKLSERFVLATGLNACAVTPASAKQYSMTALSGQAKVALFDQSSTEPQVEIKSLQVGSVTIENIPAASMDVSKSLSLGAHPDAPIGWLGTPLLSAVRITLDFDNHSIAFDSNQSPRKSDPNDVIVPLTLRDGRMYVHATVPGAKPFLALIDTGTLGTLLPFSVVGQLGLKPAMQYVIARPNGKEAKLGLVFLPVLSVGKADCRKTRALFVLPGSASTFEPGTGVLGIDFLRRFRVTFDYSRRKMILAPLVAADAATGNP